MAAYFVSNSIKFVSIGASSGAERQRETTRESDSGYIILRDTHQTHLDFSISCMRDANNLMVRQDYIQC